MHYWRELDEEIKKTGKKMTHEKFLDVRQVTDRSKVRELMRKYSVSLGNAETVQLVLECEAELVLANEVEVRQMVEGGGFQGGGGA